MLSSTFVVQSSINIRMAEAKGAVQYEQKDLSITLQYGEGGPDNRGPVFVNNVEIQSMEELSRILAERHAEQPDIMVLIRPDRQIESARLIEVLGIANSVGIERYGIAAQPTADEPQK
jgi:biopolymer transport protein ExbD